MPQSSFAWSFPQAVIWGILGCVTSFAVSLTTERTGGTLVRLMLSPIARWQILAGKAAACFVGCLAVATLVLLMGRLAFGVHPRSLPMLAVGVLCIGAGFVGVMMLVATMGKTAGGSSGAGRAVLLVLAMIGGGSIPLFAMPQWMQTVSGISPFKWAIQALDAGIWRPLAWGEFAIPCAVLLGFGVVGFALGARLFTWTERA
jgi:ABC-2 type transport system permease protein